MMNTNEIKKAWNTFKKEIAKEISFDLTGCCYMNKKQLETGTATILLCNDIDYDWEIARQRKSIDKVNGYDTWTAEEKKNNEERCMARIRSEEADKAKYGNKANEAETKAAELTGSKAFKKLAEVIGLSTFDLEFITKYEGLNAYQIRIHY